MKKFKREDRSKSDRRGSKRFGKRNSGDDSERGNMSGRRFGRRDSGRSNSRADRPTPTEVNCDKCGKRCEVPFKPTSSKPVYCSDCFRKKEKSDSRGKSNQFAEELEEINAKVDRILKALEL